MEREPLRILGMLAVFYAAYWVLGWGYWRMRRRMEGRGVRVVYDRGRRVLRGGSQPLPGRAARLAGWAYLLVAAASLLLLLLHIVLPPELIEPSARLLIAGVIVGVGLYGLAMHVGYVALRDLLERRLGKRISEGMGGWKVEGRGNCLVTVAFLTYLTAVSLVFGLIALGVAWYYQPVG